MHTSRIVNSLNGQVSTRRAMGVLLAVGAALAVGTSAFGALSGTTRVVAASGDPAPDGGGNFLGFSEPSLNDSGQAAFVTRFGQTDMFGNLDYGAYRADGNTLVRLARVSQPLPGGSEPFVFLFDTTVERMGEPPLNALGQVAIGGLLGTGGNPDRAIIRTNGATFETIVRQGDSAPQGGTIGAGQTPTAGLNDMGQVLFEAVLTGAGVNAGNDSGMFRGDGASLTQIVRKGDPIPGGGAVFTNFDIGSLNNLGRASFVADLSSGIGDRGIFVGDGASLSQVVRTGQSAPGGNGTFLFVANDTLNDLGQVAFLAELTGTSGGFNDDNGVYRGDGASLLQIAREGQAVPSGGGTFGSINAPALNAGGQVLFHATITSATPSDRGIFRSDGVALQTIVRKGQLAPEDGKFDFFRAEAAFNDAGQALFFASLTQTSQGALDNFGLFLHHDTAGLLEVARKGDSLLGSTITDLAFGPTFGLLGDERSALNNLGQVAFRFNLADGRAGIAIWTLIPEPTSMFQFAIGCVISSLLCRRPLAVSPAASRA